MAWDYLLKINWAWIDNIKPYYHINTRVSHDINSRLLMKKKKTCINIVINARTRCLYMAFTYVRYRAPRKARASNEKLKSARNEYKTERLYAYENVIEVVKYSAPYFFRFCTLFLSFLQNLCNNSDQKCFCHPFPFARSLGEC